MSFWDEELAGLMREARVPGAACAVIRNGRVDTLAGFGVRSVRGEEPVDAHTVFEAASLSKPVFALLVLQLVERGALGLDMPLSDHLPGYIAADPRAASITIGHVLSHSSGLPNWRTPDYPLRTHFDPGTRFSYSGEGYHYLQKAIEAATGEDLDALARRLVFGPLGMERSSYVWQPQFRTNRAYPHDEFGTPALGNKPAEANAAWSLQTCVADYARFLLAVLLGAGHTRPWLAPRVAVRHHGSQALGTSDENVATGVAWGLGWGLETDSGTFFHWGDNGAFKAFTVGFPQERAALVVLTNGASGLSVMPQIVARLAPGERASLRWLDYARHDAPVRRLLRVALAQGAEAAWAEIAAAALKRDDLIWIARGLNVLGRAKDSAWLRARADPA